MIGGLSVQMSNGLRQLNALPIDHIIASSHSNSVLMTSRAIVTMTSHAGRRTDERRGVNPTPDRGGDYHGDRAWTIDERRTIGCAVVCSQHGNKHLAGGD